MSLFEEELRHGEEELGVGGNEDDNKDEEVAYDHLVYVEAGVDVDTYKGKLQGAHLEADPADAEVDGMDSLRQLVVNVDKVVGLQ